MLDKEALQMIVELVEQRENSLESVYAIIDKLDTGAGLQITDTSERSVRA